MQICPECRTSYEAKERFCPKDNAPLVEKIDIERIGTTIGNYRVLKVLGRGGMGTVYRGEHIYIGKPVAVKLLHERFTKYEDAVKRFLREARAASSINHPNIVDVTDFGPTNDGGVFFVMEYLEGESLEDLIGRESPLELHRAINIVNQMAAALAAAHDKGIVHRDLKPENVYLVQRPGRRELIRKSESVAQPFVIEREKSYDFVKILDFGIAKVQEDAEPGSTLAGAIFGTPEYMSPEAARGAEVDWRADIYALGVIFFDMLTGRVPFDGDSPVQILAKHIGERPPSPRTVAPHCEITEAAERLILRAMAKSPDDRQQSMDELRAELQQCFGSVAYRRDAARIPGAKDAGVAPRPKRLTEELDEWLQQSNKVLAETARKTAAARASAQGAVDEEVQELDDADLEMIEEGPTGVRKKAAEPAPKSGPQKPLSTKTP